MRRDFLKTAAVSILSIGTFRPAQAEEILPLPADLPLVKALSITCWQRTRTQQMLKDYIMIGLNSNFNDPQKHLKHLVALWDMRIRELTEYFHSGLEKHPEKMAMWNEALHLWDKDKTLLLAPPTKENALTLQKDFKTIIHDLSAAKVLMPGGKFKAVAKAGHLCRAPQFMANAYLMRLWGIDIPDYDTWMQEQVEHFDQWLAQLKAYPHNTPQTLAQIEKAREAVMLFRFMYGAHSTAIPSLIYKKADEIFEIIRKLKDTYTQDIIRRSGGY